MSFINRMYLQSDACSQEQNNLLAPILIAGSYPAYSYIYYENNSFDVNSKKFTNRKNNSFQFTLLDQYFNAIQLNGLNLIFTIFLYKKDNTSEMHGKHLHLNNLEKIAQLNEADDSEDDSVFYEDKK